MSTGTLTLTQNSTAVVGSGTLFTTELDVGGVVYVSLNGVNHTLVVSSIASNTQLTLAKAFTGATQSGITWTAIPRDALIGVHAQLAADNVWARRAAVLDKQNWYQVFTGAGTITVTLPDGSTFSGPSWNYLASTMATKVDGAVPVTQGGTGATTVSGARKSFGLGTDDKPAFSGMTLSNATGEQLTLKPIGDGQASYLRGYAYDGTTMLWAMGKGSAASNDLNILHYPTSASIVIQEASGDIIATPGSSSVLRVNGGSVFSSSGSHTFNGDTYFVAGGISVPGTSSDTVPIGAALKGISSGLDTASFDNANNINLYSWYGIGFCTSYTSPTNGVVQGKPAVYINTRTGTINAKGAVQANGVTLTSDWNAKEEVSIIDPADALEKIVALDGFRFRYKDAESERLTAGALAQDIDLIIPDLVIRDEGSDFLTVDYMGLIGYLLSAVKGLKLQVDEYRKELIETNEPQSERDSEKE